MQLVLGVLVSLALAAAIVAIVRAAGSESSSGDASPPPAPVSSASGDCPRRPYDGDSPWNRRIRSDARVHPRSAQYIRAIADNDKPLTSDPDQYTPAVYEFDERTPLRTMKLAGYYSNYSRGDDARRGYGFAPTISKIPVPENAVAPPGSDGQVVFWNPKTGVEHSFWQFDRKRSGEYAATNGYQYSTKPGFRGRFADGKAGRGAGLPYLAGLVRRCEVERDRIDHALAFSYDAPSSDFVYPASKSDGQGSDDKDLPEGTRLQLDPDLGEDDFKKWKLPAEARTIARALQRYGMYVVDSGGSSKIFLEARQTAGWDRSIGADLVSGIPWKAFRVVRPPSRP